MNIYCLSEGELYNIENGKEHLVHCERVESYRDAVRKMKARDEWKTTGKGAKFMGVEPKEYGENEAFDMLRGIGSCGDRLIYTTFADMSAVCTSRTAREKTIFSQTVKK